MNKDDELNFEDGTNEVNELHFVPFDCYLNDKVYILECKGLDEKSFDSEDYLSGEDINSEFIQDEEPTNDHEQVLVEALDLLKLSENKINKDTNCKKIPAIETYADTDESTSHDEGNGGLEKDDNEVDNANVNKSIDSIFDEEIGEAKPKTDNLINIKDPAYRPRKGWFFQHDTRDEDMPDDGIDEDLTSQKIEKRISNEGNLKTKMDGRWTHDLFDEYEQSPKTPEEILLHYGHDIRDEDTTSNGIQRRSRKFRRNIPKYNRDWQDADAYNKKKYPPHQAFNHLQADKNTSTTNRISPKKFAEDRNSPKPQKAFHNPPSSPSRYNNRYRDYNDENKPPPLRSSKVNDYKADPYKFQNTGYRAKHNSESSYNGRDGGGGRREEDQGVTTKRYSHTRQSFPQNETNASANRFSNRPLASGGGRDKENVGPLKDNNYNRSNNYSRSSNFREQSNDNYHLQQQHRQMQRGNGGGSSHLREISPNAVSNYRGNKGEHRGMRENDRYYGKRSSPSKRGEEGGNAMQQQQSLGGGTKAYTKSRKPMAQEEAAQASHQQNHNNERYGGKSPYEQGKMFSHQAYAQPLMSLQEGMVQVSPTHPLLSKAPHNLFTSASAFLTQNQQQQQPMFYPPIQQVLMQRNNLNNMPPVYAPPNNMSVNSLPYLRLAPQLSQGLFANPYLSSDNHNFLKSPFKVQNTLGSTTFYNNNENFTTPDQMHYLDNNAPFEDSLNVANASFPYPFYSPFSFVNPQTHLENFGLQDPSLLPNASNTILNPYPNFGIHSNVVDNNHHDEIQHHSFPHQDSVIRVNNSNTSEKIKMNQ